MPVTLIPIGQDYLVVAPNVQGKTAGFRLSCLVSMTPEAYGCAVNLAGGGSLTLSCSTEDVLDSISPADPSESQEPERTPEEKKAAEEARQARAQQILMRSAQ